MHFDQLLSDWVSRTGMLSQPESLALAHDFESAARKQWQTSQAAMEKFVAESPELAVGLAVAAGMALGWYFKRH